jgi:hypothetical protein
MGGPVDSGSGTGAFGGEYFLPFAVDILEVGFVFTVGDEAVLAAVVGAGMACGGFTVAFPDDVSATLVGRSEEGMEGGGESRAPPTTIAPPDTTCFSIISWLRTAIAIASA